ncbi:hypothetical protein EDB87DRAFT_1600104 [Lactarius vividus]|nr:hypothetical protein EDB87DRAFT_1600104 [Lactarius vividus]
MLFWRVGRGSRQSLHQLVRSLAVLLSPSSFPSFALTHPRVQSVPLPRHHESSVEPGNPSPKPTRPTKCRHVVVPPPDPPLEHPISANGSSLPQKDFLNISGNRASRRIFSDSRKVSRLAQHMISTRYPRGALLVLVTAHRLGCPLGKEVYESVARRLAEAREWRLISTLALLQKRHLGRHTARLLDWRTRALIEVSHFAHLDRVLGWFEEGGLLPTRRTYHLLLYGHLRNRNIVKAMGVIQQMLEAGFTVDSRTQATVVSAYRTLGPDVGVQMRALNALKDADARTSTHILNALLQISIDSQDSERLLSLACHFDFGTFDACQLPLGGFRPLPREGENAVLSQLIRSSCQSHTIGRIPPDIATYTILLHYIASHGDLLSALSLLEQLERSNLVPDDRFIASLVRLYFVVGRPNAAIDVNGSQAVFQDIRTLPLPRIINALAIGLSRLHGIDGLQACLRLMQLHTKALLESHLVNAEGLPSADVGHISKGFSLNEYSLSHLVQSLASRLHYQFRAVKRSGLRTRSLSLQAQTPTTGKSFDPTAGVIGVLPIIQSLTDRGVLADRRMFALRIRHEAGYHYAALMEGHAAVAVMNSAERGGIRPNCVLHTILIVVLRHMVAADAITSTLLSLWPSVAPLPRDLDGASLKVLGRVIPKKLSEHERQVLVGKLEELSSKQEGTMYTKGHGTLRRELSQLHLS